MKGDSYIFPHVSGIPWSTVWVECPIERAMNPTTATQLSAAHPTRFSVGIPQTQTHAEVVESVGERPFSFAIVL